MGIRLATNVNNVLRPNPNTLTTRNPGYDYNRHTVSADWLAQGIHIIVPDLDAEEVAISVRSLGTTTYRVQPWYHIGDGVWAEYFTSLGAITTGLNTFQDLKVIPNTLIYLGFSAFTGSNVHLDVYGKCQVI